MYLYQDWLGLRKYLPITELFTVSALNKVGKEKTELSASI